MHSSLHSQSVHSAPTSQSDRLRDEHASRPTCNPLYRDRAHAHRRRYGNSSEAHAWCSCNRRSPCCRSIHTGETQILDLCKSNPNYVNSYPLLQLMHSTGMRQLLQPNAHDKLLCGIHVSGLIVMHQSINVRAYQAHQEDQVLSIINMLIQFIFIIPLSNAPPPAP